MMKKIILITCIMICMFSIIVLANNVEANRFKIRPYTDPEVKSIGTKVIGYTKIIGTIVALATLVMIGIKLMLTAPSAKADVKGKMVPYLVGAVMVFSIVQLLDIVYRILN